MHNSPHPLTRAANSILIAVFLVAIGLPLASRFCHFGPHITQEEKRKRAPPPRLEARWTSLWAFPSEFAAYYADHFGFRAALIRLHALVEYCLFGVSPTPFVLVGRDGWLYYADDSSLDDYRSATPFQETELAAWKTGLEARRDWLNARGIRFLVVLTCDKHVIYPDFIPPGIRRAHATYRLDQLAEYLAKSSTLDIVNVRDALDIARRRARIYHRTDSHWNDLGAHAGYREIVGRMSRWFPAVQPLPYSSFQLTPRVTPGLDLAVMMGLEDIVTEENLILTPRNPRRARTVHPQPPDAWFNDGLRIMEVDDASLPKMMMFRDSFASALAPFMAEHFRRSLFLWQYEMEPKLIGKEKPDMVILEIAGRRLQWLTPKHLGELPVD